MRTMFSCTHSQGENIKKMLRDVTDRRNLSSAPPESHASDEYMAACQLRHRFPMRSSSQRPDELGLLRDYRRPPCRVSINMNIKDRVFDEVEPDDVHQIAGQFREGNSKRLVERCIERRPPCPSQLQEFVHLRLKGGVEPLLSHVSHLIHSHACGMHLSLQACDAFGVFSITRSFFA